MKKLNSIIALAALAGAVAFVLQTNDRDNDGPLSAIDVATNSPAEVNRSIAGNSDLQQAAEFDATELVATDSDLYMADAVAMFEAQTDGRRAASAPVSANKREPAQASKAASATNKMSAQVAAIAMAGGPGLVDLIVSYEDYPELFEDGRIESLGGEVVRRYTVIDQLAVRIPAEALIELAIEDTVDRLSLDEPVMSSSTSAKMTSNRPVYPSPNRYFDGRYMNVAIIDTGVADHSDLSWRIRQYSFLNGAYPQPQVDEGQIDVYNDDPRVDGYGHGTHVAGLIAGTGSGSYGAYTGPATDAKLLSLQVLDSNGQGQVSDVVAALDWLLQYGDAFDIDVVNLSLGKRVTESNTTDPLVLAVEQLWDSGMVVVVAAGNQGHDGNFTVTSPGNSRKVITVGALTDNGTGHTFDDDYVSTFSSRGPTPGDFVVKPDLVAPGNRLVSTISAGSTLGSLLPDRKVSCISHDCNDDYLEMSGTSMAAPLVTATAALMLEKDPWLTPASVKARLMRSARKFNHSPIDAGAGLLDIDAALSESGTVSGDALSPLMVFDDATGGTLIQETAILWGDTIWGSGYLWTDGVNANGYLWTDGGTLSSNGYLWTDGGVDANGYLWTDGGVFANGYLWTDGGGGDRVAANGYLWTDGGGSRTASFFDPLSDNPQMLDDEVTSD